MRSNTNDLGGLIVAGETKLDEKKGCDSILLHVLAHRIQASRLDFQLELVFSNVFNHLSALRLPENVSMMSVETDTATTISVTCGGATPRTPHHRRSLAPQERQRLLLENLSEVRHIARRIHIRLPRYVLFDDLVQSGVVGLIDAVDKFDPTKNVQLRSYARFRIRGAILDSLRELDWGPRLLRRQARRIERAHSDLASELGRLPSEPEVAARLGVRLNELQHILTDLHCVSAGTQQAQPEFVLHEEWPAMRSDPSGEDPFQLCVHAETTRMLTEAIDTLGERDRRALALYYLEERTMKEVGRVLNVRESRVSQIVSAALDRLRKHLQVRLNAPKWERQQNFERRSGEKGSQVRANNSQL